MTPRRPRHSRRAVTFKTSKTQWPLANSTPEGHDHPVPHLFFKLLYNRHHIISILESGLLFREDSIEVEQESPGVSEVWAAAGGGGSGWLTRGERLAGAVAVCACVAAFPPRALNRTTLVYLVAYASLPVSIRLLHRRLCRGALAVLLARMRDYLALARRAAACLRECKATRAQLDSVSSVLDSTHTLLCRQQSELAVTMSASSALLGNVPWLRSDVMWGDSVSSVLDSTHALLCRQQSELAVTMSRASSALLGNVPWLRSDVIDSVSSVLDSTHALLCRQQSELAVTMSRASSALLGNVPWLRSDVAWDAITRDENDNLMKIHHAFLVVQSTLLKHIAMAHFIPSPHAQRLYKNHNERLYWIHNTLIQHLTEEFTENYEALERMYRLLKNYGNADQNAPRKPGEAIKDTWLYSEVHNDIARTNLELKIALNKCNNLDLFLDSCALHKQELDLNVLNKDIDNLIDNITKSLGTAQSSQIRLKKLISKFTNQKDQAENEIETIEDDKNILKIEDREPETRDEVFYFVKTDDDVASVQPSGDVTTGPGKKEKDATKIVLNELRRKLVNREDVMRERERQALAKTMPEFKDKIPEFPRQIEIEDYSDRKGFINKLKKAQNIPKTKLFRKYKIQNKTKKPKPKYRLKTNHYLKETDINAPVYEANSKLNTKSRLLTFTKNKTMNIINVWQKEDQTDNKINFSDLSDGLSDVESVAINKNIHQAANFNNFQQNGDARNFRFSKRDLELSPSTSDDSDLEFNEERNIILLKDVRKHRPMRKKNHPDKRGSISSPAAGCGQGGADESLRPAQYSLGAGLAMASVLQVNSARFLTMGQEEVFIGDGEVSEDSGNDEDA